MIINILCTFLSFNTQTTGRAVLAGWLCICLPCSVITHQLLVSDELHQRDSSYIKYLSDIWRHAQPLPTLLISPGLSSFCFCQIKIQYWKCNKGVVVARRTVLGTHVASSCYRTCTGDLTLPRGNAFQMARVITRGWIFGLCSSNAT